MKKLEELLIPETNIDLSGRVIKIKQLGKKLTFMTLAVEDRSIQVVYTSDRLLGVKEQDIINVNGVIKKNPSVLSGIAGFEIHATDAGIKLLSKNYNDRDHNPITSYHDPQTLKRLEIKSKYLASIRKILDKNEFTEVKSPSIVNDMIENYDNKFSVDFFGKTAYLTISNILYHQILIANDLPAVYEISPIFRSSKSQTRRHLSEIMMLDYSQAYKPLEPMVKLTNDIIRSALDEIKSHTNSTIKFDTVPEISYSELLSFVKNKNNNGAFGDEISSLFKENKEIIEKQFGKWVWVYDSPIISNEDFFKSRKDSKMYNCVELRYTDLGQIASGSSKITDYNELLATLSEYDLKPEKFMPYVSALKQGIPPNSGIGLGIDRLFMTLLELKDIRDTVPFPVSFRTI